MESLLTYKKVEGECAEYLERYFTSEFRKGYVQCEGFVLTEYFQNFGDRIRNMKIRADDLWLCSIPKSGTTWVQEAIWCIANNMDLEGAKKRLLTQRFPFLETTTVYDSREKLAQNSRIELPEHMLDSVNFVDKFPSPRFVKSHLPLALLPIRLQHNETNAKIVYIVRNPRDTCISYYHHSRQREGYRGDFEIFSKLFLGGAVNYLPYWDHVLPFWRMRNHPNALFLVYEEMKKDLRGNILKIAEFLEKTLDEEQIRSLVEHLSFENMKKNPMVNMEPGFEVLKKYVLGNEGSGDGAFMRCGRAGQWRDVMGQTMVERFQKWEQENLKDIPDYPLRLDS